MVNQITSHTLRYGLGYNDNIKKDQPHGRVFLYMTYTYVWTHIYFPVKYIKRYPFTSLFKG